MTLSTTPGDAFLIGEWRVEPGLNRISRGDEVVVLQPKVMALLVRLAERPGLAVDRESLITDVWPGQVVTDSSLYQAVASLRKALGDSATERRYVESVSSRGYRLIASVRPCPGGSGRSPQGKSRTVFRRITLPSLVMAGATILVVLAMAWWDLPGQQDPAPALPPSQNADQSIARLRHVVVLPWRDDSADQALDGFADALHDAVLSQLVRVQGLQIVAPGEGRPDAFGDYDAMLRGRVQYQDGRLRVHLNLVRSRDGAVLWAAQYDGNATRLFELQDQVVDGLLARFDKRQAARAFEQAEPQVFSDYLLGRVLWARRTPESLQQAEQIFQSVVQRAPDFAQGYVGLCDSYFFASVYRDWTLAQALEACSPLLEKALLLDPDLGEALATKALFLFEQGEEEAAAELFTRAIDNAPSYAFARMWYGNLLRQQGQLALAARQHETAIRLAPFSPIVRRNLAYVLLNQGRVVEARQTFREALALEPRYSHRPVEELEFFDLNVRRARAFLNWVEAFPRHYQRDPNLLLTMAQLELALGRLDQAQPLIETAAARAGTNPSFIYYVRAIAAIVSGEHEEAEAWFRRRMDLGANELHYALPYIASLRCNGRIDEARQLAERFVAALRTADIRVTEENHYQLMGYASLLHHSGDQLRAEQLGQQIDQFLVDRLDVNDINHLDWIAGRGQSELAAAHAADRIDAGWLPSYNAEPFSAERMQRLLGVDDATFERMLRPNREAVLEVGLRETATRR